MPLPIAGRNDHFDLAPLLRRNLFEVPVSSITPVPDTVFSQFGGGLCL